MTIAYGIVAAISILCLSIFFIIRKKVNNDKILKVFSVIGFIGVAASLFIVQAIDQTIKFEKGPFEKGMTIFMVFLRWCTTVVVACGIFYPFYKTDAFKRIITYIMPVVTILNLLYLTENFIAIYGYNADPYANYRTYGLLLQIAMCLVWVVIYWFNKVVNKDFK